MIRAFPAGCPAAGEPIGKRSNNDTEFDYTIKGAATVSLQLEAADLPDQCLLAISLEVTGVPEPIWRPTGDGVVGGLGGDEWAARRALSRADQD